MDFDFAQLAPSERYRLLTALIVPRPIAWVTTLDAEGCVNAAPFSFFNVFGSDPAVVAIGVGNRAGGAPKDTARNIEATGEFVLNTVVEPLLEAMSQTSFEYPAGQDELAAAGLTRAASRIVKPPRIAESPAAFECRLIEIKSIGANRLIIGEVVRAFIDDAYYDAERRHVLTEQLGIVGRMHGSDGYARTRDLIKLPRPTEG